LEGFVEIGHIAKLHGFKGEVSLFLDVSNVDDYRALEVVFLDIDGNPTPFIIKRIKPMNKGFIVLLFEGISSESEASFLLRKKVFLPDTILPALDEHSFYDHEVLGFSVVDTNYGPIGEVDAIIDHPANPLLQLAFNGKEILIPLNVNLNKRIDRKTSTLTVTTPEGLLSIYLD
jgi:16S rRNA processing protein RimM